ncbi:MAG: helix-turn-helix transcriptional regulator [Clostridia bacterium]|nr:helix-turn-helix transcriptional regulator [Clostridia bacterium]
MKIIEHDKRFVRVIINIIISVIIVTVVSSLLVWYYSNAVLKKYQYNAINYYQQNILESMETNIKILPKAVMQIFDDEDISKCMNYDECNDAEIAEAMRKLSDLMFYYNIDNVKIIHKNSDSYWTSDDMNKKSFAQFGNDSNTQEVLKLYSEGKSFISGALLSIPNDGLFYTNSNFRNYIFILRLIPDEFMNNVLNNNSPFMSNTWLYYNGALCLTDSKEVGDATEKYAIDLNSMVDLNTKNTGNTLFVANRNGNYTALTAVSNKEFMGELYRNIAVLFAIMLIVLIICALSLVMHSKYYRVIKNIYSEKLKSAMSHFEMGSWMNIIFKVFSGIEISDEEREIASRMIGNSARSRYVLMLVLIDGSDNENAVISDEQKQTVQAINEAFSDYMCYVVQLEKERMGVVICYEESQYDELEDRIRKVTTEYIREKTGTIVSFVTRHGKKSEKLEDNVIELFKTVQYHFVSRFGELIKSEEMSVPDYKAVYPKGLEQRIALALKENDIQAYDEGCNEFIKYITENNYLMGRKWGTYLYMDIMDSFGKKDEADIDVSQLKNIREIFRILRSKTENKDFDEITVFKDKCKRLVEENYRICDYSVQLLAEALNISPVYAGQKFKKEFDISFNAYLAEYRCNMAAKMLVETNKKTAEIASECGFRSDTYFNYTFKKYMHTTPSMYRRTYKNT